MLLMLEPMQNLFKLAKGIDTFVCDLVTSIIICIIDIYAMYIDLEKRYDHPYFKNSMIYQTIVMVFYKWSSTWTHKPKLNMYACSSGTIWMIIL